MRATPSSVIDAALVNQGTVETVASGATVAVAGVNDAPTGAVTVTGAALRLSRGWRAAGHVGV